MNDVPQLLIMLKTCPQPLSQYEEQQLNIIQEALDRLEQSQFSAIDAKSPEQIPKYEWIEHPLNLTPGKSSFVPKTIYETKNKIYVNSLKTAQYETIQEGIDNASDGDSLVLEGSFTEEIIINKNIHFLSNKAFLINCKFIVNADNVTFKDFKSESGETVFIVEKGFLSLNNCEIRVTGDETAIKLASGAKFELYEGSLQTVKSIECCPNVFVNIYNATISGKAQYTKADVVYDGCKISEPNGTAIEAISTILKIKSCHISDCKEVAISVRERSSLTITGSNIAKIQGAGLLVHGYSTMIANNIRLQGCQKAGVIMSHDAVAEINGSLVHLCGLAGIEVLYQAKLIVNETWISEHKGSCILCDVRSTLQTTRCVIAGGKSVGIEASNASAVHLDDTLITGCYGNAARITNSRFEAQTCEFRESSGPNLFADDGTAVFLTNCNIIESKAEGIVAESDVTLSLNSCFVEMNAFAMNARGTREVRLLSTSISNNSRGMWFENGEFVLLDDCRVIMNSVEFKHCVKAIVRRSMLSRPFSRFENERSKGFDAIDDTALTLEENSFFKAIVKIKASQLVMHRNKVFNSQNFAVNAEKKSEIAIENNEFVKCHQVLAAKDGTNVRFLNNKVENCLRTNKTKADQTLEVLGRMKMKALNIKEFSKGLVEGNFISGDYDYAIFIDGQSNVECRANQIQVGERGGILYNGISSGSAEDNNFSGKGGIKTVEYAQGCYATRH